MTHSKIAPATAPHQGEGDVNTSPGRRKWRAKNRHAAADRLLARDSQVFLHQSVSTPCLAAVRKAEGIWIEDVRGRRYMDFHGNNVHHIGYGHPRLVKAVQRQLDQLPFSPRRYTCEPAVALAEKLAAIAPGQLAKMLFATGGSDAVEIALFYARAATGHYKTISFWDAFHGAGFGARSIGGEQMFRSGPAGPLLAGCEHVPPFGDYRNAWGVKSGSADLCARQIRYILEKEGDIAAVIAEPIRAVPYVAPPGFWRQVRSACDEFGALLIFDEIPTGLGKTGKMFACEHDGVIPDILVIGKSLGGGLLPIAATICHPDLDVCGDYALGHYTHEKNPVSCRAALETIAIIEQENLVENARIVGEIAIQRLLNMQERFGVIGDVRGRGCLFGAELVRDRETREKADALADDILYRCLDKGLSFKTTMGNVLTFTPPLMTSESQMHSAMDIVESCFEDIANDKTA